MKSGFKILGQIRDIETIASGSRVYIISNAIWIKPMAEDIGGK